MPRQEKRMSEKAESGARSVDWTILPAKIAMPPELAVAPLTSVLLHGKQTYFKDFFGVLKISSSYMFIVYNSEKNMPWVL